MLTSSSVDSGDTGRILVLGGFQIAPGVKFGLQFIHNLLLWSQETHGQEDHVTLNELLRTYTTKTETCQCLTLVCVYRLYLALEQERCLDWASRT